MSSIRFILTFLSCLLVILKLQSQHKTDFTRLSPKINNTSYNVKQVLEDDLGFIWLVNSSNLIKYDGYNYLPISINSIFGKKNNSGGIKKIIKDHNGFIWVLSNNGLLSKQNKNGQFELLSNYQKEEKERIISAVCSSQKGLWFSNNKGSIYFFNLSNELINHVISIPDEEINDLIISNSNNILIKTKKGNIFNYSTKSKKNIKLKRPFNNTGDEINLAIDKKNNLWITTLDSGIYSYQIENGIFKSNTIFSKQISSFSDNLFISIYYDSRNNLWFGTDGDGVYKINLDSGKLKQYKHDPFDRFSLSTNTILNIGEDAKNNIWILTNYGNVNVLPYNTNQIDYYSGTETSISTRVLSILKSRTNDLWIGTSGNGLTYVSPNGDFIKRYAIDKSSKKGFYVFSLLEDQFKNIWIGTYQNGLWTYNPQKNKFEKIKEPESNSITSREIRFLFKDSKNRIWATSHSGINIYDSNKNLLAKFYNNTKGLEGLLSQSIIEDKYGSIWIAFNQGGLFKFNENLQNFQNSLFIKQPLFIEKQNTPLVLDAMTPDENNIWIIKNGALHKYNTLTKKHDSYAHFTPLQGTYLLTLKKDEKNNLWLSSINGIWKFNTVNETVENYQISDGFQSNRFMYRSAFKDNSGKIYFGGVNGVNSFYPKGISKQKVDHKLNINSVEILNKPANLVIPDQLKEGIKNTKIINLKYNQSSISFRFSAIGNILNPDYFYASRLKGFNNEWVYSKNELKSIFTNIPSGKYTYELKAGTKKGLWDIKPKEIIINIENPWWLNSWAFALYLIVGSFLFYGVYLWIKLKSKLVNEEIINTQQKEMYAMKMNFFTKMSHEIQTPLTLILGPIEELLKSDPKQNPSLLSQRLKVIFNNAKRLSKIASELTTARNNELGKLKLQVAKSNIIEDLKEITDSFNDHAQSRNIGYDISIPFNKLEFWYDKDKIEHILYNLLSNAFKFTPKDGEIQFIVQLPDNKENLKILVQDSGPGIPKDDLDKIFDLFYQSNIGKQYKGSGIGLALVKELIELHHGKINIISSSKGTRFEVTIPTNEAIYSNDEKLINQISTLGSLNNILKNNDKTIEEIFISPKIKQKTVLIVEDNYELQLFLTDVFKSSFNVIVAENGKEGYELSAKHVPHLIISDIMMPVMNGLEMCIKLQQNSVLSHIPIILLTAKNTAGAKIKGLKSGAIEYINKPFNINELVLKVTNILKTNQLIKEKYKKELISFPKTEITKSPDEIFLENLISEVENAIKNPDFKLKDLANKFKMSQTSLYRKCVSLTGKTLVDFVRLTRLRKAAIVIAKYKYSVSEAAYMVGFNDPKYFSKCFKKEFDISPKAFQQEGEKRDIDVFLSEYNLKDSNLTNQ